MPRTEAFMDVWEAYGKAFPESEMFDSRSMSLEDFENLEDLMKMALERGTPLTEDDLEHPVPDPDPENGLVF